MVIHVTHLACLTDKQAEGTIKATGKNLPKEKPHRYKQICKRFNRLTVNTTNDNSDNNNDEYIIMAICSSEIKITNKGHQWRIKNGMYKNKTEKVIKVHVAVNVNTREIHALEVADEKVSYILAKCLKY